MEISQDVSLDISYDLIVGGNVDSKDSENNINSKVEENYMNNDVKEKKNAGCDYEAEKHLHFLKNEAFVEKPDIQDDKVYCDEQKSFT